MILIDFFITIILLFLILGLLIFVHELGHFLAAKLVGVEVEEFAFGFGKNLFAKKYKDTTYKINLIFLGGYVKLLGDEDGSSFSQFKEKKYSEAEIKKFLKILDTITPPSNKSIISKLDAVKSSKLPKDEKEAVLHFIYHYLIHQDKNYIEKKSFLERLFILTAGVLMNIILAIIIFSIFLFLSDFKNEIVNITHYKFIGSNTENVQTPIISLIYNSKLKEELFNSSDKQALAVISIDGKEIKSKQDFEDIWRSIINREVQFEYMYLASPKIYNKPLILNATGYDTNIDPELKNKIIFLKINENSSAFNGGIKEKDILLSINGEDVVYNKPEDFVEFLENHQGGEVYFRVLHKDGNIENLKLVLNQKEKDNDLILGASFTINDILAVEQYKLDYSNHKLLAGVYHSINMFGYNMVALKEILWQSFKMHDASLAGNSLSSVWGIGEQLNTLVVAKDYKNIINLTGLISIALAFMNILPIPLLDGGQVLFLLIEKLRKKPLSRNLQEKISKFTFIFLVALSILIIIKDIWMGFVGNFIRKIL